MNEKIDTRAVARYLDREMDAEERRRFEARLETDARLRAEVEAGRELSSWFAPERRSAPAPVARGFRDRVVEAVRESETNAARGLTDGWIRSLHRISIAAAILCAVGLLVWVGLLRSADSGRLEASPAEVERVIDELDALIEARDVGPARHR